MPPAAFTILPFAPLLPPLCTALVVCLVAVHTARPPPPPILHTQVYSLGFHQAMLELTAHAANKGLLLLALWRAFAMLWDGALQVRL